VRADGWSAVVKVLSRDAQPPRSDEPTDIYYWRRESLVYEHDLPGLNPQGQRACSRFK